jgi:hypothetical protein
MDDSSSVDATDGGRLGATLRTAVRAAAVCAVLTTAVLAVAPALNWHGSVASAAPAIPAARAHGVAAMMPRAGAPTPEPPVTVPPVTVPPVTRPPVTASTSTAPADPDPTATSSTTDPPSTPEPAPVTEPPLAATTSTGPAESGRPSRARSTSAGTVAPPGQRAANQPRRPTAEETPQPVATDPVGTPPDRAPASGSHPRAADAPAVASAAHAGPGSLSARWMATLTTPEAGMRIFAAGLFLFVFSVGGLVTVTLRRRRY